MVINGARVVAVVVQAVDTDMVVSVLPVLDGETMNNERKQSFSSYV